jgi:glycogen debranching enzyme
MAGIDNKQLAYANVVEITRERTPGGYVPNYAAYPERKSYDRSQPPVGAMVAWRLFDRWGDKWFLEEIYTDLLTWNRWWDQKRRVAGKYLTWGSNRVENWAGNPGEQGRRAAILESGLDNSPMYDQATYDDAAEALNLADAGLMGMYIGDCHALARMADVLGKPADTHELNERADRYTAACRELWDEAAGIFLNRHTDTDRTSPCLSPTNFYPLIGEVASLEQAQRMIKEHLYNPDEFWGEWMLPSCSRKDSAYREQRYWRGPIWGPMNMLVYMGLEAYDLPEARRDLAEKSAYALLKEWREHRHIHENYNSMTGEGCSSPDSNPFYHWGALLALIPLMEAGHYRRVQ